MKLKNHDISPVPVVYYHSVAFHQNPNWVKKYLTLGIKYFEDQLKFFKQNRFQTVFLTDYFQHRNGSGHLPRNSVCITFDDGYLDNWIYVYPLLKKYGMKATIFVSPEFIDTRNQVRGNLEMYWNDESDLKSIDRWGFLSWDEMRIMEKSGHVDIQSHTLSHTKHFVSGELKDFHHPGRDSVELIGNIYPHRKPYYIEDESFEELIPYGYPVFEEASSIIGMNVDINPDLIEEILSIQKKTDWTGAYTFDRHFSLTSAVLDKYQKLGKVINRTESQEDYSNRIYHELKSSREKIEGELEKRVYFCCWPYGDYTDFTHQMAVKAGYRATAIVINPGETTPENRFSRIGLYQVLNNRFLSRLKAVYKVRSHQGLPPYRMIRCIYNRLKYGI